jgi:hypothetical protein
MNSNKALETLYFLLNTKFGENQARTTLTAILGNILYDLKDQGLEISEENLSQSLQKYVSDFQAVSQSVVA